MRPREDAMLSLRVTASSEKAPMPLRLAAVESLARFLHESDAVTTLTVLMGSEKTPLELRIAAAKVLGKG